ncbi:DinB family protein [Brevibacterium daeguense]|uniref:DinB family protein n=1 Tax=Brevibacterium daeguense TaxID=909936 RepID=A0ABP8EJW1_9MICO|nr:DUF664 domain-containing protein [Brevibacterium daeguense]
MPFFAPEITTEADALPAFLRQQMQQLRSTAFGLSTEQARTTPLPSALSISGLLAHTAQVVYGWLTMALRAPERLTTDEYIEINRLIGLHEMYSGAEVPQDASLDEMLVIFDRVVDFIAEAAPRIDLAVELPKPVSPWMPEDHSANGRWVWLHLIAEVGRHAGHADLIREAIDGKISYELNFLVDGGTEEEWQEQDAAWS